MHITSTADPTATNTLVAAAKAAPNMLLQNTLTVGKYQVGGEYKDFRRQI